MVGARRPVGASDISDVEAAGDVVRLPAPLEQQLEAIVENAIGSTPLVQTLAEPISEDDPAERVVVTGIGIVSPVGLNLETFWENIAAGRSGIDHYTLIPNFRAYPSQIGGEVKDFDPRAYMDFKEARRMSRMSQFGVAAARMAFDDSGLKFDPQGDEAAVVMGVGGT
ncbi:MAG TPA: beta-ketoacyl synthase N-terminal-like domain-containing protein, partial [Herpetosiphonaceae bacterium]|nr:beta-ketoacyl synthase N-terminal-like domain-containing protein [Herpetosiphonaceae bacterium]